jgi:DNA-binding NarL/FixJ family response regulator
MSSESIRVLLVEDNLGDARLLYVGMEEALPGQFQMTHVKRLSEALEFLWKETCDVVLLDLGLPDSHGIDTLVLTRAQAPSVPIVVLTGFQDESLGDQALKEGAQDYLVKGQVDSKMLARSMRYAIARKAVSEALIGQGVALAKAGVLRVSRQRLIAAHERVRRDIASQLHQGVQKRLLDLRGCVRELLKGIDSTLEPTRLLSDAIDELTQKLEQVVGILRRQLYPSTLNMGMVRAFQSFRDQFGSSLALEIEVDETLVKEEQADRDWIPEQIGLAAYRIAEEALTNVVKHAKAGKVTVRLDSSQEGWLRLTVRDNGQGFGVDSHPDGLGMGTMQDYAEAVDGECSVHSDPGGSEITAVLPLARSVAVHLGSSDKGTNDGNTERKLPLVQ